MSSRKKKKYSAAREVLGFSIYLLLIVILIWIVHSFVFARDVVVGDSMYDTLEDGDNLIINRLSYRLEKPQRFDIVVFPSRNQDHSWFIKRIIGLPGEKVRIDPDGRIFINEKELPDRYGTETILDAGTAGGDGITLGAEEYFVMGDNRNVSMDSRREDVGLIRRDDLIGKVVLRIWPLKGFGKVQ